MELGLLDRKQQLWRRFKSSLGLWGCANPLRLVVIWTDLEKIGTRPYLAILCGYLDQCTDLVGNWLRELVLPAQGPS